MEIIIVSPQFVRAEAEHLILANIMDECFMTMSSSKPDKLCDKV